MRNRRYAYYDVAPLYYCSYIISSTILEPDATAGVRFFRAYLNNGMVGWHYERSDAIDRRERRWLQPRVARCMLLLTLLAVTRGVSFLG